MKTILHLIMCLILTCAGRAADLTFSDAPQSTDSFTVLQQRIAVALRSLTASGLAVSGSVAVTGTFWQATQPVSAASLPLPAGAATSANQATEITSLATIATNSGTAATAANQATAQTSLSSIVTNTALLGTGTVMVGNVAAGASDSGSPVKTGGIYNSTKPTLTNGLRGDINLGSRGSLCAQLMGADSSVAIDGGVAADTDSNGRIGLVVRAWQHQYNGASWDRVRTANVFKTINAVTITNETTIWTPASGKKFRLMGYVIGTGATGGSVTLKDNTSGTTIRIIPLGLANGTVVSAIEGSGTLSAAANNVLTATGGTGQVITGYVFGTEE